MSAATQGSEESGTEDDLLRDSNDDSDTNTIVMAKYSDNDLHFDPDLPTG